MLKEKLNQKASQFQFLHLVWILPLCFFLFICSLFTIFSWENIYGAAVEFLNRYPNSELIWEGTYSGPTGDYGSQEYIIWTADDTSLVETHYQKLSSEGWYIKIISVQELDIESADLCNRIGYWQRDRRTGMSYNDACDAVKAKLPSYGTVIIFSYTVWVG